MTIGLPYACAEDRRRPEVRTGSTGLNGIDFLEVVDAGAPEADRQRLLRVTFLGDPSALVIGPANVRIDGGERIPQVPVTEAAFDGDVLVVRAGVPGDHSTYTLRLVEPDGAPLAGLDPPLSAVAFSFKVECPSVFDCRPRAAAPARPGPEPAIDYLARDYESFRRLLLDRLALVTPGWTERNPADAGIALVELVAYLADHLSYRQDAVATEAYLGTARRRISIRRHALLLDYPMHDGCNARAFAVFEAAAAVTQATVPAGTAVLTEVEDAPVALTTPALAGALVQRPVVFETMHDVTIRPEHDAIALHGWGERECCLPEGATRATLAGHLPDLRRGDLLLLEEVIGPQTGEAADADPQRRHVVRLAEDPLLGEDELLGAQVTEVAWHAEDALPFTLCLSGRTDAAHGRRYVDGLALARANVALCDHGLTLRDPQPLGAPPAPPARFAPALTAGPLTRAARVARTAVVAGRRERLLFDPDAAAAAALRWDVARVLPVIAVRDASGRRWLPQRDLLSSDAFALEFVAELDDEGVTTLRFGDGEHGARPAQDVELEASYRVGNGAAGNIGAGTLRHVVTDDPGVADAIASVRNPLSATGGTDPEDLERARLDAPAAFRTPERAVTPDDYAAKAELHPDVQRAQATLRWTGSWRTVFLTVDRRHGRPVDRDFEAALREHLERFRMAGHDLEIDGPRFVAIDLALDVCAGPGYFRSDVTAALLEALGRRGHFDPDRFTFGQPVLLSPIVAAAAAVPGVRDVRVTRLERLGVPSRRALEEGTLAIGRLEIARLDNDPSYPERGVLRLDVRGGR